MKPPENMPGNLDSSYNNPENGINNQDAGFKGDMKGLSMIVDKNMVPQNPGGEAIGAEQQPWPPEDEYKNAKDLEAAFNMMGISYDYKPQLDKIKYVTGIERWDQFLYWIDSNSQRGEVIRKAFGNNTEGKADAICKVAQLFSMQQEIFKLGYAKKPLSEKVKDFDVKEFSSYVKDYFFKYIVDTNHPYLETDKQVHIRDQARIDNLNKVAVEFTKQMGKENKQCALDSNNLNEVKQRMLG